MTSAERKSLSDLTPLPTFPGGTYAAHVEAWRLAHATREDQHWRLAAIAAFLARSVGGSPRHQAARQLTVIQRFCRDVRIDRQTFHRLTHTYRTFAKTRTTGGTGFIPELSFKHYEVASRRAKDPVAAVREVYARGWSANELQRQLFGGAEKYPFSLPAAIAKLQRVIVGEIGSWPYDAQAAAPEALQRVMANALDDLARVRFSD